MRSGKLDFDTGKWVDDPPPAEVEESDAPTPNGHAAIKVNGETKYVRYFEVNAPSAAGKARQIQERRQKGK